LQGVILAVRSCKAASLPCSQTFHN
jgi:hypothetical protein